MRMAHLHMQNLREIAAEKLRENGTLRTAMLELIARREAIAFVGAGLSAPLKYPQWPKLLEILQAEANRLAPFKHSNEAASDALLCAEEIQQHFEKHGVLPQFRSILGREYGPREQDNCTPTHRRLVKLPFKAFVTTNYEECLEQALNEFAVAEEQKPRCDLGVVIKSNAQDRHLVSRFLRSIVDGNGLYRRHVAHMHGCHNDVENIILSASDYARAYGFGMEQGRIVKRTPISTLHRQLAWTLFASRRMVFFGCSMDDPYLKALLDAVSADLWEWRQPIHFVVLPLDEKALVSIDTQIAEFERYGLQVVLFDNWDGTFIGLDQLLDEAYQMCSPEQPIVTKATIQPAMLRGETGQRTDTDTLSRTPGDSISLAWLEEVNESTAPNLKKNED